MISYHPPQGRPALDRINAIILRINTPTLDAIDQLAREHNVTRSTVIEALVRSLDGKGVAYHIPIIENENKKYPEKLPPPPEKTELSPEDAFANYDPLLKETYATEEVIIEAPGAETEEASNLWTECTVALMKAIGPQNFTTWLDCVRFLAVDDTGCVTLLVPNTYFQEYLTEHYTEVIEETLSAVHQRPLTVRFDIKTEAHTPAPKTPRVIKTNRLLRTLEEKSITTVDQLEEMEDRDYEALCQQRLTEAQDRATPKKGSALTGIIKGDTNHAQLAEEVAILKSKRLKEERRREEFRKQRRAIFAVCGMMTALRQPGTPQDHRQYEAPSAFATEGGATRKDRDAMARALRNKAPS